MAGAFTYWYQVYQNPEYENQEGIYDEKCRSKKKTQISIAVWHAGYSAAVLDRKSTRLNSSHKH